MSWWRQGASSVAKPLSPSAKKKNPKRISYSVHLHHEMQHYHLHPGIQQLV
jgi:hypothetical protein